LQDRDSDGRQADTDAANNSRNEHLPVSKGCSLDRGSDDDDQVCEYDGALSSDLLAEDEGYYSSQRATYIIDSRHEACHGRVRVAEYVLEALGAEDTPEEALVIFLLLDIVWFEMR
jgi:hypothetical protein